MLCLSWIKSQYTTLARLSFVLAVDYFQWTHRLIAAPFIHYNEELSIHDVQWGKSWPGPLPETEDCSQCMNTISWLLCPCPLAMQLVTWEFLRNYLIFLWANTLNTSKCSKYPWYNFVDCTIDPELKFKISSTHMFSCQWPTLKWLVAWVKGQGHNSQLIVFMHWLQSSVSGRGPGRD